MAELEDLRRFALGLPSVYEQEHFGGPSFRVANKTFALFWAREQRTILKLPRPRQELLLELRPDTFAPVRVGRVNWSWVELSNLTLAELADFTVDAWRAVAPTAVSKSYKLITSETP